MSAVVVVSRHTTGSQRDAIDAACARAGIACVSWRDGAAFVADPALVVAGLLVGQRRIPSDVVAIVDDAGDDVPLLLLTTESLVRPSVTLQLGRVVVVAEPHGPDRLYGHVRRLARRTAGEAGETVRPRSFCAEVDPSAPVSHPSREAVTAVVPLVGEIEASHRAKASEWIERERSTRDEGNELQHILGERAGILHLSADAATWSVYWPAYGGTLFMYSATRLPCLFDLAGAARAAHPRLLRLRARSGDTVMALTGELGSTPAEIAEIMSEGAPLLLHAVRERARGPLAGLVAEVR